MISATDALLHLQEGNRRFVLGTSDRDTLNRQEQSGLPVGDQEPLAIILGCSDSRVPAEIVFDQGLGDLFVIRVAGNIVAPSQVGSVEFAAQRFGTRLVVVLGHSRCGAVTAALEDTRLAAAGESENLRSIVSRIRPALEPLLATGAPTDPSTLLQQAVRANICASADHLRHGSDILERLIREDGLLVVGAEYSLDTGITDFFDGFPDSLTGTPSRA